MQDIDSLFWRYKGNYGLVIALLAVYAVYVPKKGKKSVVTPGLADQILISITNYWLLLSLGFLVFGFAAINKFGALKKTDAF